MSRKLTNEEFLQRLKDSDVKYIPLEEYNGTDTKIKWMCYKNKFHIFEASPYTILKDHGCPYCCNLKILIGYNDLATTRPDLAKRLLHKEDGYKYTSGSNAKVGWVCPDCGHIFHMRICKASVRGLNCPNCSDGISYPEKFVMSMLQQLDLDFVHDRPRKWSNKRRYDFYIEKYNMIIECHGLQHYENGFSSIGGNTRSLEEEIANDIYKKDLAINNNIENYIVLNCSYSDCDFIKSSILESSLNEILDFSQVDWDKCDIQSRKSYYFDVLKLWNDNFRNPEDIANKLHMSRQTIEKALHILTDNGLCDYDPKKSIIDNASVKKFKRVICLESKKVYESIKSVSDDNFSPKGVSECCNGRNETHKRCHWMFYEDYLKQINNINNTGDNYGKAS